MANFSRQSFSTKNDALSVTLLGSSVQSSTTMANIKNTVDELINPDLRENALQVLSKRRDMFHELAPLLWNTACIVTIFLQEIISVYPAVLSLELTSAQSIRVCNVLALLQCLASHSETRIPFLNANMPQYFYPFLRTKSKLAQFEYLRVASLGVIGALVKANTEEVIRFLLSSEVATFILQFFLANDEGLDYICATAERFFAVARVLEIVLGSIEEQPCARLLKLVISCYSRLSYNHRAAVALGSCLPITLMDGTFIDYIREDPTTVKWMETLHENIRRNQIALEQGGGGGVGDIGGL
ncbi:hypothetical protein TSUD_264370 [Trifolium subterraneum]|uniref:Cell differentiation protein rcd1 n=1 Tax=Trifolium subterraneum TaxID=3900 RepID=A0A2Z6MCY7_TRISU|nr:hypothetical protein TSUD_264370 [Trifolium subterraneum]